MSTEKDKILKVVAAVIYNENSEILIAQRKDGQQYWEFPGGKIEEHESNEEALQRELKEELNLEAVEIKSKLDSYIYTYPKKTVELFFYDCNLKCVKKLAKNVHVSLKWVKADKLNSYNFLPGNKKILRKIVMTQRINKIDFDIKFEY